jgi:hypothetical protein
LVIVAIVTGGCIQGLPLCKKENRARKNIVIVSDRSISCLPDAILKQLIEMVTGRTFSTPTAARDYWNAHYREIFDAVNAQKLPLPSEDFFWSSLKGKLGITLEPGDRMIIRRIGPEERADTIVEKTPVEVPVDLVPGSLQLKGWNKKCLDSIVIPLYPQPGTDYRKSLFWAARDLDDEYVAGYDKWLIAASDWDLDLNTVSQEGNEEEFRLPADTKVRLLIIPEVSPRKFKEKEALLMKLFNERGASDIKVYHAGNFSTFDFTPH